MENFSSLASKLREEFVVKDGWTKSLELVQPDFVSLRKTLISQFQDQISKIPLVYFLAKVRAVCMGNFSFLALKLWETYEVKDGRTKGFESDPA